MRYMNQYDMAIAAQRNQGHPVKARATLFLIQFAEQVNEHSDGWAYWQKPLRAASKLIELVESGDPTEAQYKAALIPIKAFYTRHGYRAGMQFPAVQ